jgi:molecular chaperone DnaJ
MANNYYIVLGIKSDAKPEKIKSAYRQKVQEFHPDHYGQDCEPFIKIQEAYSVLSDPVRRRAYDDSMRAEKFRVPIHADLTPRRTHRPTEPLIPHQELDDLRHVSLGRSFHTYRPSFDEIFDRLLGDFLNVDPPKSQRSKNLNVEIPISREQASRGGSARVYIPARMECPICDGFGNVGFFDCMRCDGSGYVSGEYPLTIEYPSGIHNDYAIEVSLDRFGIYNFYLTVHFRIAGN